MAPRWRASSLSGRRANGANQEKPLLRLRQRRRLRQQRLAREQQDPPHLEAQSPGRPNRDRWKDHQDQGVHPLSARREDSTRAEREERCLTGVFVSEKREPVGLPFFLTTNAT